MARRGVNKGRPYGGVAARSHVTGDHEGRPYGKKERSGMLLEGEGRFPNRPYGKVGRTVECNGRPLGTPLRGRMGTLIEKGMTGKGVNKGRPYGGRLAAWSHVTGDHKGRPYVERGWSND